ncbi:LysE family translocator [Amycolatopsis endophytica]
MAIYNCTMTAAGLTTLAVFAVVATITPGGATTLATASGAHFGFRRSIPLMAGIAVGLATMAAAAAAGLGGLVLAAPALRLTFQLGGTVYLLWLAIRTARSGSPGNGSAAARPFGFLSGVWMLWHNPKGWAMTVAAAASFASLTSQPTLLAGALGAAFGLAAAASLTLWCLAGLVLARVLRTERQWTTLNIVLALLLVASIVPIWTAN